VPVRTGVCTPVTSGCAALPEPAELRRLVRDLPRRCIALPLETGEHDLGNLCRLAAPAVSIYTTQWAVTACCGAPGRARSLDSSPMPPELASNLRIFVVSGAFGDCRDLDTIPYGDEIQHLSSKACGSRQ